MTKNLIYTLHTETFCQGIHLLQSRNIVLIIPYVSQMGAYDILSDFINYFQDLFYPFISKSPKKNNFLDFKN